MVDIFAPEWVSSLSFAAPELPGSAANELRERTHSLGLSYGLF
jgi:hypothetical protein